MTEEQLKAAWALVPFAFGKLAQSRPNGLIHDWMRCIECGRLRAQAFAAVDPDA